MGLNSKMPVTRERTLKFGELGLILLQKLMSQSMSKGSPAGLDHLCILQSRRIEDSIRIMLLKLIEGLRLMLETEV